MRWSITSQDCEPRDLIRLNACGLEIDLFSRGMRVSPDISLEGGMRTIAAAGLGQQRAGGE